MINLLIPNMIEPHTDELIYSYITRLSYANGFTNINDFLEILNRQQRHNNSKKKHWTYDGTGLFSPLLQTISPDKLITIINTCSLYHYQAIFMDPHTQAETISALFNNDAYSYTKQYNINKKIIKQIVYCKECATEDTNKYGHQYPHRSHHLPGVTYCHIHKTQLYHLEDDTPVTTKITDNPLRFAEFSADLLRTPVQTNLWVLQYVLLERIYDNPTYFAPNNHYQYLHTPLLLSPMRYYYPLNISTLIDAFDNVNTLIDYTDRINSMIRGAHGKYDRYGYNSNYKLVEAPEFETNYQALINRLTANYYNIQKFIEKASNDYDVFKPFNPTLICMRHKTCGTIFFTTPDAFINGWKCPKCTHNITT